MPKKKPSARERFVNVDPNTLDITISGEKQAPMAIRMYVKSLADMPPIWELVYYRFMYRDLYGRQKKLSRGIRKAYCLAPPPPWFVAIAGVMWEGIIQGATWDTVKLAVNAAISKLRQANLLPNAGTQEMSISIRAGFEVYSTSARKQYGLFLAMKRIHKNLPDQHSMAYGRARDRAEFGRIVRAEHNMDVPDKQGPIGTAPSKRLTKKQ